MNEDLRAILKDAMAAIVICAFNAGTVVHKDNPGWERVVEALNDCVDELQATEVKLGAR